MPSCPNSSSRRLGAKGIQIVSNRAAQLRLAVAAFDKGDLTEAADALEKSDSPIDRENAVNCRNLAFRGAAHMVQTLGYLLKQHLGMAEMFKERKEEPDA